MTAAAASVALVLGSMGCGTTTTPTTNTDAGVPEADAGWQCTNAEPCAAHEFCNTTTHACEACTEPEIPQCEAGLVADWQFGNGCLKKVCCEFGTGLDPATGECVPFATADIVACPFSRVYECYIKFFYQTDDPSAPMPAITTGTDVSEAGVFAIHNGGLGTLHISSMGLSPETSPVFKMVSPQRTELAGGDTMVVQFSFTPTAHRAEKGEFVMQSDAENGPEWRIPVIGDTVWTECTQDTVHDDCIVGQYCDINSAPATCAECFDPHTPMCANGNTVAQEPYGSNKCVEFYCQCGPGDVYLQRQGCKAVTPCTPSCTRCEKVCTRYPDKFCGEEQKVDTCLD